VGVASSFLALSRNLGMMIGVAFAEMIIALRGATLSSEAGKGGPSLESIQGVWKLLLVIGLAAIILSWARRSKSR